MIASWWERNLESWSQSKPVPGLGVDESEAPRRNGVIIERMYMYSFVQQGASYSEVV
jgi:hypothetical protein